MVEERRRPWEGCEAGPNTPARNADRDRLETQGWMCTTARLELGPVPGLTPPLVNAADVPPTMTGGIGGDYYERMDS
jgi:hypothetical protein